MYIALSTPHGGRHDVQQVKCSTSIWCRPKGRIRGGGVYIPPPGCQRKIYRPLFGKLTPPPPRAWQLGRSSNPPPPPTSGYGAEAPYMANPFNILNSFNNALVTPLIQMAEIPIHAFRIDPLFANLLLRQCRVGRRHM